MRFTLPPLFQRISLRWPLLLAVAFSLYSAALLTYSIGVRQQMRADAKGFLVADSNRRATALADLVAGLHENALDYADIHEIRTYLTNRDLGMSPRYGLNYSLEMIRERFSDRADQDARRWGSGRPRIVYLADDGEILADTTPESEPLGLPAGLGDKNGISVDAGKGLVLVVAPVLFRNRPEGRVVVAVPIEVLYRNLLAPEISSGYRELLMTDAGDRLHGKESLSATAASAIARIPENAVLPFAELASADVADSALSESLVLKTRVPGLPLTMVTLVPNDRLHGSMASLAVLFIAAVVPLILLFVAFRLDRLRLSKERLQQAMAVSERERLRVEIRNSELAEEIQRRETVERALSDSEQRWQLAVAGTNDGIWDWNPVTGETFFSARWKSMLGYDEGELANDVGEWRSRIHPDDFDHTLAEIQRHLRGETGFYECEHRLRCKDGSYKWILDRGRALFDDKGTATRVSGSHTDTTDRRLAEARLQDRTEQLNAIFELSPDGFVSFDSGRRVKFANPAFTRMTGIALAQINGLDEQEFSALLADICLAAGRFRGIQGLRESAAGSRPDKRELIELSLPGKRILEVCLRASDANSVSQILYFRDVTHETEVDRMKSEFLSTAAHELRTPMASIYGFAEILLTQDLDEASRNEFLSIIFSQSELMASILNELLDLARIEARRGKDFVIESTNAQDLVNEVVSGFKLPEGRSAPTLALPAVPPYIMADHKKAQQAILNVLSNAYKYSPAGGAVHIELVASPTSEEASPRIGIRITDQGIGMTPAQLARVFERFYRADTSGKIPGTGLGMSIVHEIVELHGGAIELSSQAGAGTSVTLWLPALREALAA
ncbi:PAS domain-containing sensor histidine kinase [Propionivibrio sp.]|uniref:PAS domain-containing sensor histidine kinase n=1 Tax=Propionivibrio sp. TaxID=2212460 RepID=UPI003BF20DA1